MEPRKKVVFNWSGGKDSALALFTLLQSEEYEVVSLLTTVNRETHRSSMHGIPLSLLRKQAESIGIPLYVVGLTPKGNMEDYEESMSGAVTHFKQLDVFHFAFGDIYLHDVRSYREKQLEPYGISVVEPLWGKSSEEIMSDFLTSGIQTVIVTTTANVLGKEFIGRRIDKELLDCFPVGIDICGENGEYHTLSYAGGMFRYPVAFALGMPMLQSYSMKHEDGTIIEYTYWFADIQEPASKRSSGFKEPEGYSR